MSIGQRITQKRKELGLSQEALGEQMGISRQAIYKWESDSALPEIDKLITLSKLFGVSVGWLLGVEEAEAAARSEGDSVDQQQMDLVEEIVGRYIAAQPKPKPRRRWPWVLAIGVLVIVILQLFSRMDQLNSQYNNLQNSVGNISNSVNFQINSIADRVEQILMAQNQLTAEYHSKVVSTDYRNNTVSFAMSAVPKTYVQGMGAVFIVDHGDGPREFESTLVDKHTFTCQATVPLTNSITISVVFVTADGTRQTQVLDSYSMLLSDSFARLHIDDNELMWKKFTGRNLQLQNMYVNVYKSGPGKGGAEISQLKLGIFRNRTLVGWAKPCDKPANYIGDYTDAQFFRFSNITIEALESGDLITVAALATDSYGRQYMIYDIPYEVIIDPETGAGELTWVSAVSYDSDPNNWIFD